MVALTMCDIPSPGELSIVTALISRLMAALERWLSARSWESHRAGRESRSSRSLDYDAYIRANLRADNK